MIEIGKGWLKISFASEDSLSRLTGNKLGRSTETAVRKVSFRIFHGKFRGSLPQLEQLSNIRVVFGSI